jgi:hypothetical protein
MHLDQKGLLMSVNINIAIGNARIAEVERLGYELWVDAGSAQVRVRCTKDLPDGAVPPQLPQAVSAALNNDRGSILQALRARQAQAAIDAARAADPIAADAKKAE